MDEFMDEINPQQFAEQVVFDVIVAEQQQEAYRAQMRNMQRGRR